MICTTQPEVLNEIKALFSWNPPRLSSASNKKSSTSTTSHPSIYYNRHLSSKFVLKRVVRLPPLVQDIANNVDKALDAALTTLPSLDGLVTANQRAYDIRSLDRFVADETGVAEFYYTTTAKYCLQVASTLALHPSASFSEWQSLLSWTQSGGSSGYAITDGRLCFMREAGVGPTDETWAAIVEGMESENRRVFEEMGKSRSALATWEMWSPSGGLAVMNTILNLGKFSWTLCNASGSRSTNPKHGKAKANVKLVDSQAPLWSFPDDPVNASLVPENRDDEMDIQSLAILQRPVTRQVTRSAASGSSTLPPQPSASCSSEHGSPTKGESKKRKRDEEDMTAQSLVQQATCNTMPVKMPPTKGESKKRKLDEEEEEDDVTAQSLVQQAWAQAVRVDGTFVVLHSGNHELVCVRHRDSQTLYVSDVIEPPTCVDPGYGKLHVGIYIAAIQDAMDRKQQLPSPVSQPNPPGDSGGFQRSGGRKVPTGDELAAIEKTIHVSSKRDVVLLYLQYDVYDSAIPASFHRSGPSIIAHTKYPTPFFPPIHTCGLEECLTIVLTSEIGRGATGVVHRGTLKPEICDGAIPLDVVVKLSFDTEQQEALKSEYDVYRHLRSKGVLRGIPTVLGLFKDLQDGVCALVTLHAGVPLVKKLQRILSVSDRESALSTLESIHCAGILHGDIRRDNILIGDSGITIIDFGHSEQCDDQKAKDKEFARLRYLLGFK